jgi:hypothetical protein
MTTAWKTNLLALAVVGVLVVLFAPKPSGKNNASPAAAPGWVVPKLSAPMRNIQPVVTDLSRAKLWSGQLDNPVAIDDSAARWRIAGITGRAKERYVLVLSGDDKITPLKAGDKFPDSTIIAEIRETGICVVLEGKKRFLPIDGQTLPMVW